MQGSPANPASGSNGNGGGVEVTYYPGRLEDVGDAECGDRIENQRLRASFSKESSMHDGCCPFVEGNTFQLLVGFVLSCNLFLLVLEAKFPRAVDLWKPLERAFLCFYCGELSLRLAHFRCLFFYHATDFAWNLLDFVVVIVGVANEWLIPMFGHDSNPWLRALRSLRFLRFLRALRLLRVIYEADFSWAESPWFQWLVGAVISFNSVILGLETDFESPLFWWIEQILLFFFVFELSVRLKRFRWTFFYNEDLAWNWMDFIIVVSGVFDQWFRPLFVTVANDSGFGQMMMLLRMLRLLRVLRLLRLLKVVRPLYKLALGMMEALQSMFWVLLLTFICIYAFAIGTTRLIGHQAAASFQEHPELREMAREYFGTVLQSMFTLFEIMTYWSLMPEEAVMEAAPWLKPVFIIFTIYSTWALLAVMSGVVSENMIAASSQQDDEEIQMKRAEIEAKAQELSRVFLEADADGSGKVDGEEFEQMLLDPKMCGVLKRITKLSPQELRDIFGWLDIDGDGEIAIKEFINGFLWIHEPLSGRSVMKVVNEIRLTERRRDMHLRSQMAQLKEQAAQAKSAQLATEEAATSFARAPRLLQELSDWLEPQVGKIEKTVGSQLVQISERVAKVEAMLEDRSRQQAAQLRAAAAPSSTSHKWFGRDR